MGLTEARITMKPAICIYHGNCADGFTAAWVVWNRWPDIEFVPGFYGKAPPDVAGKHVLMVDYSYKRDFLEEMGKSALSITILDHHATAKDDLSEYAVMNPVGANDIDGIVSATQPGLGNIRAIFRMDRSGAQLAYDFVFGCLAGMRGGDVGVKLIDYVADRDLWLFKLPKSRVIAAYIFSHAYTFKNWAEINIKLQADFQQAVNEGSAIERKHHKDISELLAQTTREITIGGVRVKVANLPYTMSSDAAGTLAEGAPFGACYFDRPDARVFSLRSRGPNAPDVSLIAAGYGGGGHKNAAGFQMPLGWEGDA